MDKHKIQLALENFIVDRMGHKVDLSICTTSREDHLLFAAEVDTSGAGIMSAALETLTVQCEVSRLKEDLRFYYVSISLRYNHSELFGGGSNGVTTRGLAYDTAPGRNDVVDRQIAQRRNAAK